MRLRTLPLSLSGIILGIFLASDTFSIKPLSVVFLILTAVFLQILSNLSNELGDAINGLDTKARKGMHYSIQDGEMTIDQMRALIAVIILCQVIGRISHQQINKPPRHFIHDLHAVADDELIHHGRHSP